MKKKQDFSKGKRGALVSKADIKASPKLKEVVIGIRYRISNLEKTMNHLKASPEGVGRVIDDYDGRIDELKTLLNWIEE